MQRFHPQEAFAWVMAEEVCKFVCFLVIFNMNLEILSNIS